MSNNMKAYEGTTKFSYQLTLTFYATGNGVHFSIKTDLQLGQNQLGLCTEKLKHNPNLDTCRFNCEIY